MMPQDFVDFSIEDILQIDEGAENDDVPEMDDELEE
jgi:hypothetical protein